FVYARKIQNGLAGRTWVEQEIRSLEITIAQTTGVPVRQFTPESGEHARGEVTIGQHLPGVQAFSQAVDQDSLVTQATTRRDVAKRRWCVEFVVERLQTQTIRAVELRFAQAQQHQQTFEAFFVSAFDDNGAKRTVQAKHFASGKTLGSRQSFVPPPLLHQVQPLESE